MSRPSSQRRTLAPNPARRASEGNLLGAGIDHVLELSHWGSQALRNLGWFTWVEQPGKTAEELEAQ